jgi:hypothetical protein
LLEEMTSLGTDFEMHAIWQGNVEDPVAKDFVARKACTIALRKAQETRQSTLFRSWKSLGDSIPKLYCEAKWGLCHARKCQFKDFCE